MNKRLKYGIMAIIIISGIFIATYVGTRGRFSPIIASGYDGLTAQIVDVQAPSYEGVTINNNGEHADLDPVWNGVLLAPDPTGLNIEIDSAVDVVSTIQKLDPIYQIINGTTEDTVKKWDITIYHCQLGVTINTFGVGLDGIYDITFTIELYENDFSFFTEPDQNYAGILEVYNDQPANATLAGVMKVSPASGGAPYVLTPKGTNEVPQWLLDSGYTGNIGKLSVADFDIHILQAQPYSFLWNFRADAQTNYMIGIDVFVAGYWEFTVEHGWKPPTPDVPWYMALPNFFIDMFGEIFGPIIFIITIGLGLFVVIVLIKKARS